MRGFAVLAAIACAACGGAQTGGTTTPQIVVLGSGSVPRQRVTIAPVLHAVERFDARDKVRFTNAVTNTVLDTARRSSDLPTLHMTLRCETVEQVAAGARVRCDIERVSAGDDVVDALLRDRFARELDFVKDARASWIVAPNGAMLDVAIVSPDASPAVRRALRSAEDIVRRSAVVFPDVEIGAGATWRVTKRERVGGADWDITTTYTLRELTGTSARLGVERTATARSQALGAEPNRSTRLTSGTAHASGELTVPLAGVFATGSSQATSEINLLIVDHRLRISSSLQTETFSDVKRLGDEAPAVVPASADVPGSP